MLCRQRMKLIRFYFLFFILLNKKCFLSIRVFSTKIISTFLSNLKIASLKYSYIQLISEAIVISSKLYPCNVSITYYIHFWKNKKCKSPIALFSFLALFIKLVSVVKITGALQTVCILTVGF